MAWDSSRLGPYRPGAWPPAKRHISANCPRWCTPVTDDHVPEDVANGQVLAEKWNFAVEVGGRELFDARDSILVNAVIRGRERFHLARALDVRRLHVHAEIASFDSEAHVGIALGQVPSELTERASALIGTEVVLRCRERAHQLQRVVCFAIPIVEEPFQFIDGHGYASFDVGLCRRAASWGEKAF